MLPGNVADKTGFIYLHESTGTFYSLVYIYIERERGFEALDVPAVIVQTGNNVHKCSLLNGWGEGRGENVDLCFTLG